MASTTLPPATVSYRPGMTTYPSPPVVADALPPTSGMAFAFFVLVSGILFVRPAEVVPDLYVFEQSTGIQLYQATMLACLAFSLPSVTAQLSASGLAARPITVCVLMVQVAIVLSHLVYFRTWEVRNYSFDFFKVLVYYLVAVSNLQSTARLRTFLGWLIFFIVTVTVLALLQFHGIVDIESLRAFQHHTVNEAGDISTTVRLRGTGMYNDPNDLCILLVSGILLCLYQMSNRGAGVLRIFWPMLIGLLGYGVFLTQSRGGFLCMLAGLMILFQVRYGWRRAIVLGAMVVPVLLAVFAGRQADLSSIGEDTSQDRIQLWSEALQLVRQYPLFGIGMNEFSEEVGLVAHNSFMHCFAELGIFGGMFFLGAFYLAVESLLRLGRSQGQVGDPELVRLRPYLLAVVAACATGLMALSRSYVAPTYLYLAMSTAFLDLERVYVPLPRPRFDGKLLRRLLLATALYLPVMYLFVKVMIRR